MLEFLLSWPVLLHDHGMLGTGPMRWAQTSREVLQSAICMRQRSLARPCSELEMVGSY